MMRWLLLALVVVSLAGCRERAAPHHEGAATASSDSGADGLCEHRVLQAICTKCNPKLTRVFQAKGDWCKEHGFPESVCPVCHPERGGRPARDVTVKPSDLKHEDEVPPDGTKVRLKTKDAARVAGIESAQAEARNVGDGVTAVTRVTYDAKRLAHVNARSRGVVRALHADLGSKLKKGAPLVDIESSEVGADRSRLGAASSRVETAQKNFDRIDSLRADRLATEREVLEARRELDAAKGEHAALQAALSVAGAGGGGGGVYTLTAPLSGVVTKRGVTIGKLVGTDEVLFEIVDTATMWADLDVPERDLRTVSAGQEALLHFDGVPERQFRGKLDFVSPELDPRTRTASARVPLDNPDGSLRANMFGQARILTGAARTGVFVPAAAVQRLKTAFLVFIRVADDLYETRRVTTGVRENGAIEILSGLGAGEVIATQGSFLLKTEIAKDSIGTGCTDD